MELMEGEVGKAAVIGPRAVIGTRKRYWEGQPGHLGRTRCRASPGRALLRYCVMCVCMCVFCCVHASFVIVQRWPSFLPSPTAAGRTPSSPICCCSCYRCARSGLRGMLLAPLSFVGFSSLVVDVGVRFGVLALAGPRAEEH